MEAPPGAKRARGRPRKRPKKLWAIRRGRRDRFLEDRAFLLAYVRLLTETAEFLDYRPERLSVSAACGLISAVHDASERAAGNPLSASRLSLSKQLERDHRDLLLIETDDTGASLKERTARSHPSVRSLRRMEAQTATSFIALQLRVEEATLQDPEWWQDKLRRIARGISAI